MIKQCSILNYSVAGGYRLPQGRFTQSIRALKDKLNK